MLYKEMGTFLLLRLPGKCDRMESVKIGALRAETRQNGGMEMKKEVLDYVVEKTKELKDAVTCSAEAKAGAERWLAAVGTEQEAEETKQYLAELEADIVTVEGLISFAESPMGAKVFGGEEQAKGVAAHGREIQAAGAKYCDCPACTAVEAILAKKAEMLEA